MAPWRNKTREVHTLMTGMCDSAFVMRVTTPAGANSLFQT